LIRVTNAFILTAIKRDEREKIELTDEPVGHEDQLAVTF
jgi:hypothetical protein